VTKCGAEILLRCCIPIGVNSEPVSLRRRVTAPFPDQSDQQLLPWLRNNARNSISNATLINDYVTPKALRDQEQELRKTTTV